MSFYFGLFWVCIVIALPHGNATFLMGLAVSLVRFRCRLLLLCDLLFVDLGRKSALLNVLYDWTKYGFKSIAFVSFAFAKRMGMIERFIDCANKYFLLGMNLRCISWGYFFLMYDFSSCTLNRMCRCANTSYVLHPVFVLYSVKLSHGAFLKIGVFHHAVALMTSRCLQCTFFDYPLYDWFTERARKRGMVF